MPTTATDGRFTGYQRRPGLRTKGSGPVRLSLRLGVIGLAAFLWHPGQVDNGTFSVVEAAHLGVPALSSDYPAMREIDQQFTLRLTWMDPDDPDNMARQLKRMETDSEALRLRLPSAEQLASQSVDRLAGAYWSVIKEYL